MTVLETQTEIEDGIVGLEEEIQTLLKGVVT
jgi:hypothetical protein